MLIVSVERGDSCFSYASISLIRLCVFYKYYMLYYDYYVLPVYTVIVAYLLYSIMVHYRIISQSVLYRLLSAPYVLY